MSKFYNESEEMYLETILILKKEKEGKEVHAIDVANYMNFSRASVSRAVQNLKSKGYIEILDNDALILLPKGEEYATKIYERHNILKEVLISLGVPKEIAEDDACKIEHAISDESIEHIKNYLESNRK